jgi:hypothetical protein
MKYLAIILGGIWGALWGLYKHLHPFGRYLATRRTWVSVTIGVAVTLLITLIILPVNLWVRVVIIFAAASAGPIITSLLDELNDEQAIRDVVDGTNSQPTTEQ